MALIRTDYGLIYNTDGSLCATLLPEGGVAVDKPTTNYTDAKTPPTLLVPADWGIEQLGSYKWKIYAKKDNPGTGQYNRIATFAGQYEAMANEPVTHSAYVIKNTDNLYVEAVGFGNIDVNKDGNRIWRTIAYTATWAHRQAVGCTNPSQIKLGDYIIVDMPQLEASSHLTAFVDGSRPVGQLSIPLIKERHSAGNITLSTTITCNGDDYSADVSTILRVINTDANNAGFYIKGAGPSGGNKLKLSYMLGGQSVDLYWNISAKNGIKQKLTLVVDGREVYLYQDGSLLWSGTIPEWGTAVTFNRVQFMGVKSQTYENTLISPSIASPETIATWHSLDAPFYDPREQIDAGARPIYAPGVQIDSTGAWGIANGIKQAGFGTDGKWVAGGGSVVADETGLKIISPNGDYSLMDANQLRFFKTGYDVPFKYLARTCQGVSPSGTYVNLETGEAHYPDGTVVDMTTDPNYVGVVAVPWERKPVILAAISALKSYDPAFKDYVQSYECYVEQDQNGFYVYGRTIVPGSNYNTSSVNFTPSAYDSVESTQLLTPEEDVTKILIKFQLMRAHTFSPGPTEYGNKSWIKIEYRLDGTSNWTNYGTFYSYADTRTLTRTVTISGLSRGKYWVRCTLYKDSAPYAGFSGEHNGIATWVSWTRVNDTVISNGDVLWLAVENSID